LTLTGARDATTSGVADNEAMIKLRRLLAAAPIAVVLSTMPGSSTAFAWGCDGHQAVAILAQRLLSPATISAIRSTLAASPVDPAIKPFCPQAAGDPIAEASTWADDNRSIDPSTAGWHFIDFPLVLGPDVDSYRKYCPRGNCVIDAIVTQYRILTTTSDQTLKANALRYLIHFIGDLHQPLHTTTNGDRGGNCLPIAHYDQAPREDEFHNFRPNLHSVWDEGTIRRVMIERGLASSRALADEIAHGGALRAVRAQAPTASGVVSWAREANALARTVVYAKLPVRVPMEPPGTFSLASCDDNNHVSRRMASLEEKIDARYERDSVPAIFGQLRLAAERLAAVLVAAFPPI
jgi:hypothetical protein